MHGVYTLAWFACGLYEGEEEAQGHHVVARCLAACRELPGDDVPVWRMCVNVHARPPLGERVHMPNIRVCGLCVCACEAEWLARLQPSPANRQSM